MNFIYTILIFLLISLECNRYDNVRKLDSFLDCIDLKNLQSEDFFENSTDQKFATLITQGDTAKMADWITDNFSYNTLNSKRKISFLTWSFLNFNKPSFMFLLIRGGDPNQRICSQQTIVSASLILEDSFFLSRALSYGGNPNIIFPTSNEQLIFYSIMNNSLQNLKILLKNNADPNVRDTHENTPLIVAASINRFDMALELLRHGADPTLKDKWGYDFIDELIERNDLNKQGMAERQMVIDWFTKNRSELAIQRAIK